MTDQEPDQAAQKGERVIVHNLDAQGREVLRYQGVVLRRTPTSLTLEARFEHDDLLVSGLHLRRGDRFVETFYSDRWYNVFAIHDAQGGRLKGWYCNVTRPARLQTGHVYAEDLALDMIVYPDGRWQVLDEEEFAALPLRLEERRQALQAITELQTMVVRREGPFAVPHAGPGTAEVR